MKELERRGRSIPANVEVEFMPADADFIPEKSLAKIEEWCTQVPVLGFNAGRYDLNLIKEHFVEQIADRGENIKAAKNANKIMFMVNSKFRFLDIINYLGVGTSYNKWVKVYGCESEKSLFPYEWFDNPYKLDYPGLPDYPVWYSHLKGQFVLKLSEWKACN